MVSDRFLSEVANYECVLLGGRQGSFLYLFGDSPYSVYEIHLRIKKQIDIKNVRKTVNRLLSLGLIQIEGYYPRNAKKYQLTSYGLFQLLSNGQIPLSLASLYKDDIIIQTILFQYFDTKTIREWVELEAPFLLAQYLERSCQAILASLQKIRSMTRKYRGSRSFVSNRSEYLRSFLRESLSNEISKFIFAIVVGRWEHRYPEDHIVPMIALAKDQKFIKLAQATRKMFEDGCRDFTI